MYLHGTYHNLGYHKYKKEYDDNIEEKSFHFIVVLFGQDININENENCYPLYDKEKRK